MRFTGLALAFASLAACTVEPAVRASREEAAEIRFVPPAEQFRTEYVFLAPDAYLFDYVNVVAPKEAQVTIDGAPVKTFVPLGAEFKVARVPIADGVHRVSGSLPVGITVYGFDDDVSYGYLGGTNLSDLD